MSDYDKDHLLAKLIIAIIVSVLLTISQLIGLPWSLILNVVAVFIWLFGVNPLGYLIETVRHHIHKHNIL